MIISWFRNSDEGKWWKKILILHTELNVDQKLRLLSDAFVNLY